MSKYCYSFTPKLWITTATANSIESKNKIYKKFCKVKKNHNKRKFMESSLKLIEITFQENHKG